MGIETAVLLSYAAMASAAVTVVGTIVNGQNQKEQANAQAQQALNESAYEADAYKQEADKIRRAGKSQVGEVNASLAASGVKIGEGTALELKKTVIQRSEEDALTAIMQGGRSSTAGKEQASLYGKAGDAAVTNSYFKAGATVLGAAADYKRGGWKGGA